MSTFLDRLGRASHRRRRRVLALWLAVLALVSVGAVTLSGPTSDTLTLPGTESQRAIDLLQTRFPESSPDAAGANVVLTAPAGTTLDAAPARAAVADVVEALRRAPLVERVADPYEARALSPDRRTALVRVTYEVQSVNMTDDARSALLAAGDPARTAGLGVEVGGDAVQERQAQTSSEVIGVGVALVVLVVTFGSLVAAGLPLLTALLGVAIGVGGVTIATGFVDLSSSTSTLALMLGLAVAIDYSLFIISRYRHERSLGYDGEEAAGRAVATAGSAVVFAGLTVVVALAALAVVGIPFLTQMGAAAAGTVAIAVVIALTLLPALLGFAGRRALGGRRPATAPATATATGARGSLGERWARGVVRRRGLVLVVATAALLVAAVPALDLELALGGDGTAAPTTTQRKAYDQLSAAFGPGSNGPLLVAVDAPAGGDVKSAAARVQQEVAGLAGVASITPAQVNQAGDTAVLSVVPTTGPSDPATEDLVRAIRDRAPALQAATGAEVLVTGSTAVAIDVTRSLSDALVPYLAVVVGLAILLLLVLFRSIVVPVKAALGFLLSVGATFGAVVAVFQWGWAAGLLGVESTGPIVSLLPIFLIGLLFGLAMDYEVFLVSRMREEHDHGAEPDSAVVRGFAQGARVVTAAAVIMASVFAGFILSDESFIKSIGFALAFGVLVDAFVVRMTIVPAVLSLLGRAAWWLPRGLDRMLPRVSVEGPPSSVTVPDAPTRQPDDDRGPVVAVDAPGGR